MNCGNSWVSPHKPSRQCHYWKLCWESQITWFVGAFPILYYAECAPEPWIIKLKEHKPYASYFNVSPSTNVKLCTIKTSLRSKRRTKCAEMLGKLLGQRCVFNTSLPPSACHLCLRMVHLSALAAPPADKLFGRWLTFRLQSNLQNGNFGIHLLWNEEFLVFNSLPFPIHPCLSASTAKRMFFISCERSCPLWAAEGVSSAFDA